MEFFSSDYQGARAAFISAGRAAAARLASYRHPLDGPGGEVLATDVALLGRPDARRTVIVVSGTHGIEGFAGSAIQTGLLQGFANSAIPGDVALVLVHALNPWGFAYARRSDHENIDCNRNFIDFAAPLPSNPGYAALHRDLIPTTWTSAAIKASEAAIAAYVIAVGQPAFLEAVSAGQYEFPQGLFFGGRAPSWSRATWEAILAEHVQARDDVVLIDLHTGLGPAAVGEAIYLGRRASGGVARARAMFGPVSELEGGGSVSAEVAGHLGGALVGAVRSSHCTPIALEFGTRPVMEVLRALQFDAWVHTHAADDDGAKARAALTMIRAFYSFSPRWRRAVWRRASTLVLQALSYADPES